MPDEDLEKVCESGFGKRVIFGTDFPVMKYSWPEIDLVDWY